MNLTADQAGKISAATFLVAGGAGFVGSHIAEFLLHAGARKVRVLDNLVTGHFRNMAPFANHPAFEFAIGDVRDVGTCKAACEGMDYVFHQAASASTSQPIENAVTIDNVNVSGFFNILVASQAAGVKRFVFASGFPAFGDNNEVQKIEKKDSPYEGNKCQNELYAHVFSKVYGMETIGLRYSNVYGQRQHPQSGYAAIIPKLIMQLIRHESPVINGRGEYAPDFIYVEDVVQANILAVLSTDARNVNQVYDIAIEEVISLHQLAGYLKEFLSAFDKSIASVEIMDGLPKDHNTRTPYASTIIKKAQELLGFQPRFSLRNGLLKSISWYWAYLPQFESEEKEKKLHSLPATK